MTPDELYAIEASTFTTDLSRELAAALREAWAEIERVRLDRDLWRAAATGRERLEAEVERLTDEVTAVKAQRTDERRLSREYAAEVERLRAEVELGDRAVLAAVDQGIARAEKAEATIASVRALHAPYEYVSGIGCAECWDCGGDEPVPHPCSTIRALDEEEKS